MGRRATGTMAAGADVPGSSRLSARLKRLVAQAVRNVNGKRLRTTGVSLFLHLLVLAALGLFVLRSPQMMGDLFTTVIEHDAVPDSIFDQTLQISSESLPVEQVDPFKPDLDLSTKLATSEIGAIELPGSSSDLSEMAQGLGELPAPNVVVGTMMTGRMSAQKKKAMLKKFGGDDLTEAAVARGLKWLATHQFYNGSWSFAHSKHPKCGGRCSQNGSSERCLNGATGLALLAFLAGGHTPESGEYRAEVKNGFEFLLKHSKDTKGALDARGSVQDNEGMYVQGICTIALCECAAMTRDPKIRKAAQSAINFIVKAQEPTGGGWRYEPRQPGDTSVVGWQVMALKSAYNSTLEFPRHVWIKAHDFLDSVQYDRGARYGYMPVSARRPMGSGPRDAMTAVGVLSRMYLGWDQNHGSLQAGVRYLDSVGPDPNNMYYNYYGTQVMHHWGGKEWIRWNDIMKNQLVRTQLSDVNGHLTGSWNVADPHGNSGGRVYMTSLAVLTLEIYYRFLPLYNEKAMSEIDDQVTDQSEENETDDVDSTPSNS